jgi:DNA polymerase-3 subunit beta
MSAALAVSMFLCVALDRRAFAVALARLKHLVPRRAALPALECVLLEGAIDALYLTASDGQTVVRLILPATITTPGSLLVPLKRLVEIVRVPGAAKVHIAGDHIAVGAASHRVATLDPTTFPTPAAPQGELLGWYERVQLKEMLTQSAYAMSSDDTRPHLHALLITRRGGELAFVATDGHRLSLSRRPDEGEERTLLVGRDTVEELQRLVASPGGAVSIRHEADRVWFASAGEWVMGPLIDATFPAYEQVVPESASGRVRFTTSELREAVRALAPKGSQALTIKVPGGANTASVHVDDGEGNRTEASVLVSCEGKVPEGFGVDARYLRELLDALGDEDRTVTLALNGELDPLRVDSATGMTAVVMPMRV